MRKLLLILFLTLVSATIFADIYATGYQRTGWALVLKSSELIEYLKIYESGPNEVNNIQVPLGFQEELNTDALFDFYEYSMRVIQSNNDIPRQDIITCICTRAGGMLCIIYLQPHSLPTLPIIRVFAVQSSKQ